MKIKWNNRYVRWGATLFITVALSLCFYYLLFHSDKLKEGFSNMYRILMPVLFGLLLAYILTPALNFIEKNILNRIFKNIKFKTEQKRRSFIRKCSVLITSLLLVLLIYSFISMIVSQLVPNIQDIIKNFDVYADNITNWANKFLADDSEEKAYILNLISRYSTEFEDFLNNILPSKLSELVKTLSLSLLGFLKVFWNFIIGFIISIYLMGNKESFAVQAKKLLYSIFERDSANVILNNLRFTHNTFVGFIGGKLVDSLIIGLLCFIGTTIMGTPYAALVSVIIGLTNIIPFFGPFLGAIPSVLLILVVDPMNPLNCVYFVIFILVLQQIDGNIIGPKILGNSTGLSSFWVIFAITVFGGMWGVFGMIVGVPLFGVIYAAARSILNGALIKKNLPIDESMYSDIECIDEAGIHSFNADERNAYIKKNSSGKNNKKDSTEKKNIELVSGMKYMSNQDEWKRRVPVKWDDSQTVTTTVLSFQTDNNCKDIPSDSSNLDSNSQDE